MKNLTHHLLTALSAAKSAGRAILEVYNRDFDVRYKDDQSPLTMADQQSHDIIVAQLSDQTGERLPILSEEGKDIPFEHRSRWEYFWLVDPLDGTKEFVKRNDEFTVNIALIYRTRPVLGVIYVPVKDSFYFAAEDLGAYRLDNSDILEMIADKASAKKNRWLKKILECSVKLPLDPLASGPISPILDHQTKPVRHVSENLPAGPAAFPLQRSAGEKCQCESVCVCSQESILSNSRNSVNKPFIIVGSRSHSSKELEYFVEDMRKKHQQVEFISAGSSLKLCLVAEGRADIYPRLGPTMEWDTAAGQAIVEQAQGRVLNSETNEPLRYNKKNLLNSWFIVSKKAS